MSEITDKMASSRITIEKNEMQIKQFKASLQLKKEAELLSSTPQHGNDNQPNAQREAVPTYMND